MLAIYKRELRSYFSTVIAYIVISATVLFFGIYFLALTLSYGYPYFSYTVSNLSFIFMLVIPILTMKSFAEEKKTKTDQMIFTAPVTITSVVLGKFFAMMTVVAIPLLIACVCPLIIATSGEHHFLVDYCTIFAVFIMTGVYVAIGMYLSSLTENQIVSAVITILALALLNIWDTIVGYLPNGSTGSLIGFIVLLVIILIIIHLMTRNTIITAVVGVGGLAALLIAFNLSASSFEGLLTKVLNSFSLSSILQNFAYYYSFDVGGLILYLTLSALFIFLTVQVLLKRRWS